MIVLLNYLPWIILCVSIFCSLRFGGIKWFILIVASFAVSVATPSYMPKGIVGRTTLPEFDQKGEVVDNLAKPKGGDYYDDKRDKDVEEGLHFIK